MEICTKLRLNLTMAVPISNSSQESTGSPLGSFALRLSVSHKEIKEAMQLHLLNICRDPKMLLRKPRMNPAVALSNGKFTHVGMKSQLPEADPRPDVLKKTKL